MFRSHLTPRFCTAVIASLCHFAAMAQAAPDSPNIHMIYMGGSDCPPCVGWRTFELPKLKKTAVFTTIRFTMIEKTIQSPVPPTFFLPEDVKPYKRKLDEASSRLGGSSQIAIMVNGEVFDYYFGSERSADDVERMLIAIKTGTKYPFERISLHTSFFLL